METKGRWEGVRYCWRETSVGEKIWEQLKTCYRRRVRERSGVRTADSWNDDGSIYIGSPDRQTDPVYEREKKQSEGGQGGEGGVGEKDCVCVLFLLLAITIETGGNGVTTTAQQVWHSSN